MLAPFGRGIAADQAGVSAALTTPWSSGPTEGYVTKLKLSRRQMYGRGKLDLLRARMVAQHDHCTSTQSAPEPYSTPIHTRLRSPATACTPCSGKRAPFIGEAMQPASVGEASGGVEADRDSQGPAIGIKIATRDL